MRMMGCGLGPGWPEVTQPKQTGSIKLNTCFLFEVPEKSAKIHAVQHIGCTESGHSSLEVRLGRRSEAVLQGVTLYLFSGNDNIELSTPNDRKETRSNLKRNAY